MRLVIIESPYAGDVDTNTAYARAALADCLHRGDAPFASHLLYTQPGVLDDTTPEERSLGIEAGLLWGSRASATVVYYDLGISEGMAAGIRRASIEGRIVEHRSLPDWARKVATGEIVLRNPPHALASVAGRAAHTLRVYKAMHHGTPSRLAMNEPTARALAAEAGVTGDAFDALDLEQCQVMGLWIRVDSSLDLLDMRAEQ